jgi:hypothetical protein
MPQIVIMCVIFNNVVAAKNLGAVITSPKAAKILFMLCPMMDGVSDFDFQVTQLRIKPPIPT